MANKILIITSYFAPAWSYGGPPKVLYLLAKELVKRGKKVTVLTTDVLDEKRNPTSYELMDGIRVHRFKTVSNLLAYKAKIILVPDLLNKAKIYIDESEIVLFSDLRTMTNWQLYSYIYRKKKPYGIFPFGQIPLGSGLFTLVKRAFDLLWVNDFVNKATWRFYQNEHEKGKLIKYFRLRPNETQFLPLPVEIHHKKIIASELDTFRNKWNIKSDDNILLFVGRLHYLKGIDILIKAVKPLLLSDKHLKLMIVGRDDGEEQNLKKSISLDISKQIIFTGPLYEKEIAKAYLISKCFVFTPRFYEETSLASLEALSYGVPVIVSQQADIPDLEEYQAGYVIKNDSKMIQKAILNLLEKIKNNKSQLKENTQRLIFDKHIASKVVNKLLAFLDKN